MPPVVTIAATRGKASEYTGAPAVFTVARTGATMKSLTVPVTLGGTAQAGADCPAFAGQLTLPVGLSCVTLTLVSVRDEAAEGAETVSADAWRFAEFGHDANTPETSGDFENGHAAYPLGKDHRNFLHLRVSRN